MPERHGEYSPRSDPKPELDDRTYKEIVLHYRRDGYSKQEAHEFALQRLTERTQHNQKPS